MFHGRGGHRSFSRPTYVEYGTDPCLILSAVRATRDSRVPPGNKPLMYEGMQIKTAPSHTLSVITDQNQKAEIALNNIALRLVHVMQPSTKGGGLRGLRGGRDSAQRTEQNSDRKTLCNEKMSRMLSCNSLTKSRRLFVRKAAWISHVCIKAFDYFRSSRETSVFWGVFFSMILARCPLGVP